MSGLRIEGFGELSGDIPVFKTEVEEGPSFRKNLEAVGGVLDCSGAVGLVYLNGMSDFEYARSGWVKLTEQIMVRPPKGMDEGDLMGKLVDFKEKNEAFAASLLC